MIAKDYFINSIDESDKFSKYIPLSKTFFKDIEKYWETKPINNFKIKPIQFTFEITNFCNCNCKDCGMSANHIEGKNIITKSELFNLIDDLHKNGIISIGYTGGEPFLQFDTLCEGIKYSNNKLDVIKIISNGFWGKDVEYYFDKLIKAGLLNNKFVKPSIYISIGEQNVELKYITNIINYVCKNNLTSKINFGIINTRQPNESFSQLEKLVNLYIITYGSFPNKQIYLTDSYYVNSNKLATHKVDINQYSAQELVNYCDNDFKLSIGEFVSPKIFMKCNGDCYPCEVFNYHKDVFLGNFFIDGINKILQNYNSNKYINFIYNYKTESFNNVIPKEIMLNNYFETPCQACEFCIKFCEENNLINFKETNNETKDIK